MAESARFARGLVVGKFAPLHLGHEHVIETALAACREVVLVSYCDPEPLGCQAAERERWLAARFPQAVRLVGDRRCWPDLPGKAAGDDAERRFVAKLLREERTPVDAVFTSEAYGDGFAALLSEAMGQPVAHICVDRQRRAVPISGTAIRADVHAHRRWLAPEVYASFVGRVVLLGGESSGKTTLAQALATRLGTRWVPEYGRELWVEKAGQLDFDDYLAIARTQVAREEAARLDACRYVFCDTSPLTTLFYSLHGFGRAAPELVRLAERPYDATVLCAPDFAFVQDGTRLDPSLRDEQHVWYLEQLGRRGVPFRLATGPLGQRLAAITAWLGAPAS